MVRVHLLQSVCLLPQLCVFVPIQTERGIILGEAAEATVLLPEGTDSIQMGIDTGDSRTVKQPVSRIPLGG